MEITINDTNSLDRAVDAFLSVCGRNAVVAFHAPMGAGKTTFIAALCRRLGVADDVASPTFSILNEYLAADGSTVCHFDFYRLKNAAEAFDMGAEDYFNSGALCLIEWPDVVDPLLPADTRHVSIAVNPDGSRTFSF